MMNSYCAVASFVALAVCFSGLGCSDASSDGGAGGSGIGGAAASAAASNGAGGAPSSTTVSGNGSTATGNVTSSSMTSSGTGGSFGVCDPNPWKSLEACGWPGPANTGYDAAKCPGGKLTEMGNDSMSSLEIKADGTVINCAKVSGQLVINAKNVTIQNSYVAYDSGKKGEDANGIGVISVQDGASVTVDHVEINGLDGVHACIWHQGTSMTANAVNCYGADDGIFSWADTGFSSTTGDNFTIKESYFHDLTALTSNGHIDGYQTEGASHGLIHHNTYQMTTDADSAIAIWDSLKDSSDILVENNLIEGGGASIYADDYAPSESKPMGGFSVTNVTFKDNTFSTNLSPCVGAFFVWYARPAEPYGGGPTDGWKRSGNIVLETAENVDNGNPHVNGQLCQ